MDTTRLSTKGQIVLPKTLREMRRWAPGTEFRVEERPEGVLLRPLKPVAKSTLSEVAGCLRWTGRPKTVAPNGRRYRAQNQEPL